MAATHQTTHGPLPAQIRTLTEDAAGAVVGPVRPGRARPTGSALRGTKDTPTRALRGNPSSVSQRSTLASDAQTGGAPGGRLGRQGPLRPAKRRDDTRNSEGVRRARFHAQRGNPPSPASQPVAEQRSTRDGRTNTTVPGGLPPLSPSPEREGPRQTPTQPQCPAGFTPEPGQAARRMRWHVAHQPKPRRGRQGKSTHPVQGQGQGEDGHRERQHSGVGYSTPNMPQVTPNTGPLSPDPSAQTPRLAL